MTTNTHITKNISTGNQLNTVRETIFRSHSWFQAASLAEKILFYIRWLGHTMHELLARDEIVPIAEIHYVRQGHQGTSHALGHAYIEAEATLMNLKQQRLM